MSTEAGMALLVTGVVVGARLREIEAGLRRLPGWLINGVLLGVCGSLVLQAVWWTLESR